MSEIEFHTDEDWTEAVNDELEVSNSSRLERKVMTILELVSDIEGHTYDVRLKVHYGDDDCNLTSLSVRPTDDSRWWIKGENTTGKLHCILGPRGGAVRLEYSDDFGDYSHDYSNDSGMWGKFFKKIEWLDTPKENNDTDDETEEEEETEENDTLTCESCGTEYPERPPVLEDGEELDLCHECYTEGFAANDQEKSTEESEKDDMRAITDGGSSTPRPIAEPSEWSLSDSQTLAEHMHNLELIEPSRVDKDRISFRWNGGHHINRSITHEMWELGKFRLQETGSNLLVFVREYDESEETEVATDGGREIEFVSGERGVESSREYAEAFRGSDVTLTYESSHSDDPVEFRGSIRPFGESKVIVESESKHRIIAHRGIVVETDGGYNKRIGNEWELSCEPQNDEKEIVTDGGVDQDVEDMDRELDDLLAALMAPPDARYVMMCRECRTCWTRKRDCKLTKAVRNGNSNCPECEIEVDMVVDPKQA